MDYNNLIGNQDYPFGEMSPGQFILGLLSEFDNRYQACADAFFGEITWKQFFAIICIKLCNGNPTVNELSDVMGSSHQNVKQILLKLEKKGMVRITKDKSDRRKQRICLTQACEEFCRVNDSAGAEIIGRIFEGIPEKSIVEAINVIGRMDANLKKMEGKIK